jgi:hypothetical protein
VLVQVATPTRESVDQYIDERHDIERAVGEINGRHARLGYPVIHYLYRTLPLDELVPLYRAADVLLVTPLRDGMNLVAKEFVATRLDDDGVLVLSEFTGAARELQHAVHVNRQCLILVRSDSISFTKIHTNVDQVGVRGNQARVDSKSSLQVTRCLTEMSLHSANLRRRKVFI